MPPTLFLNHVSTQRDEEDEWGKQNILVIVSVPDKHGHGRVLQQTSERHRFCSMQHSIAFWEQITFESKFVAKFSKYSQ